VSDPPLSRALRALRPRPFSPRYAGILLGLGILYYLFGRVGLLYPGPDPSISPVWPDTGIAIAAVVLLGYDVWPAFLVGAFLFNFGVSGHLESSLAIAAGNTLEGLVGGLLVRQFAGGARAFESPRGVLTYLGCAGFLAPAVSASVGGTALTLSGLARPSAFLEGLSLWWVGDGIGAVGAGSVAIILLPWLRHLPRPSAPALAEALGIGAVVLVTGFLVLWYPQAGPLAVYFRTALILPGLIWAAFRFGPGGAALASLALTTLALAAVAHGTGPFAGGAGGVSASVEGLRVVMAAFTVTALLVAAESDQRRRIEGELEVHRRTLEERIAERTATLASAQALAHLGSWDLDLTTGEVRWSEEMYRIYGYGEERFPVTLARAMERIPPGEWASVEQNLRAIVRGSVPGLTTTTRFHLVLPGGEVRNVEAIGSVAAFRDGRPTHLVGTVQDVTERDRMLESLRVRETELLRSNRDLEQFAYVASHDLQEPLGSIEGYTRLLEDRYRARLDRDGVEFLRHARTSAVRMRALIDDLLDFSRATAAEGPRVPVALEEVLDQVWESLRASVEAGGATLRRNGPLPAVEGNPAQLRRLFQNLLSNAVKFRGTAPARIEIDAQRDDGRYVVTVTDRGIGIPPEYHARVFDIFQRLHTREEYPGSGIGLAICRRVIEAHGGRIWIESDGVPGHGTAIKFTLPAATSRPAGIPASAPGEAGRPSAAPGADAPAS
jgi:signal transduction histidine kinase/integral membrane sensor domain MASE1